jgi:hypothetical protein
MASVQWFVYPVENGVELVVDSILDEALEVALAAFVAEFEDMNLATEWIVDGGAVMHFVPAPVAAVPAPRRSGEAEERSRAAHPGGKGRRIPRQDS